MATGSIFISISTRILAITGSANNIANQIKMEQAGLRPVPVIHNIFNLEIDYYVKSGKYDYLALGSSQVTNFNDLAYAVYRIK
jgi:hypothetical protein